MRAIHQVCNAHIIWTTVILEIFIQDFFVFLIFMFFNFVFLCRKKMHFQVSNFSFFWIATKIT